MTDAEMILRIRQAQELVRAQGLRWSMIRIELGPNAEAKHVDLQIEIRPPDQKREP